MNINLLNNNYMWTLYVIEVFDDLKKKGKINKAEYESLLKNLNVQAANMYPEEDKSYPGSSSEVVIH